MTESTPEIHYEAVPGWPNPLAHQSSRKTTGVAVDSRNRVHVLARDTNQIQVFDDDGSLLRAWGENLFVRPHD